jgi:hypothetical protein
MLKPLISISLERQLNIVHMFITSLININFNTIFPSPMWSLKWPPSKLEVSSSKYNLGYIGHLTKSGVYKVHMSEIVHSCQAITYPGKPIKT